jgi:uncharacterized protein
MAKSRIRVVFDTNIYFALIAFKNPALEEFFATLKGNKYIQIFYSDHIKDELVRNLEEKKYKFSNKDIDNLFKGMELTTATLNKQRQPQTLRDKDDWHIFALAHFSEANYLISGDKDILDCKPKWNKTKILTLREFWQEMQELNTLQKTDRLTKGWRYLKCSLLMTRLEFS